MLNRNSVATFDMANIGLLFSQMGEVIESFSNDFGTLQHYASTPIKSEKELLERAEVMDELADMATSNNDIAMIFVNAIADRIEEYEDANLNMPTLKPSDVLAGLMKLKNVKQIDLDGVAKQGVISDLLNEKRTMNIKQIKGFSEFFSVPASLFMG